MHLLMRCGTVFFWPTRRPARTSWLSAPASTRMSGKPSEASPMLKYLLDTNFVIYVIKQRPLAVLPTFNRHHGRMAISAITLAELMHGAEKRAATQSAIWRSSRISAAAWKCRPTTWLPQPTMATSGLFWKNRARPLALTTCISPARPAAGGWYWWPIIYGNSSGCQVCCWKTGAPNKHAPKSKRRA